MKNYLFILLLIFSWSNTNAQCLEISSIFVNSCGPTEGENEMFTFEVGANHLFTDDIDVIWPNTMNNFLNWCQSPSTAASTAALNATILTSCGWLLEPTNDSIPAGASVLVVTSTNISLIDNSFEGLADTMYIIYQCAGNTSGHFANSGTGTRNLLVIASGTCNSSDLVTYDRSLLLGGDGATVLFDAPGNATYINNGCNAPVISYNTDWSFENAGTFNGEICNNFGTINLDALLSANATTGGTWIGPRVTGNNYNPNGYLGLDSVTYSIATSCSQTTDSVIVFNVVAPPTENLTLLECDSVLINGTWYNTNQTINTVIPASTFYSCDSTLNVDLTITHPVSDSVFILACASVSYNGTTYTSDTIVRDTIPVNLTTNVCSDLFISEYIEGQGLNRALEIYNGTGATVDLSNYTLEIQRGNTTTPEIIILSGMLVSGDVYVIHNDDPSVDAAITAVGDLASSDMVHDGDDSYTLKNNGVTIDIFGNVGCDPGQEWTDLGDGTKDNVLYRLPNYTTGVLSTTTTPCDFPTLNAMNWVSLDDDDNFTFLGSHTANCLVQSLSTCDSIYILEIDIADTIYSQNPLNPIIYCSDNDSAQLSDGTFVQQPGTYYIPGGLSANGCDSFIVNIVEAELCNTTCTFDTLFFEGFEYDTVAPEIDTSTIFGDGTPNGQLTGNSIFIGKQHSGTRFAYFNFKTPPGTTFYRKQIEACSSSDLRFSFWHRQYGNNLDSEITVNVYDGPDNTYPLIYTLNFTSGSTSYNQVISGIFSPTSSIITYEMVDNVGGPVGGNDLLFDDFIFEICNLDAINMTQDFCALNNPIDLYDLISTVANPNGTWSGPSALTNGYEGTFNPLVNTIGDYTFIIPGNFNCVDTSFVITPNYLAPTPVNVNLTECDSALYNNTWFFSDTTFNDTIFSSNNMTCDSAYQVTITINSTQFTLGNDTTICMNDTLILNATTTNATYNWQDGSTSNTLIADDAGLYWVDVTSNGCTLRDSINIIVEAPSITISNNETICLGDSIELNATGTATIVWSTSETTNNITVSPISTTIYTAQGTSALGCETEVEEVEITVQSPISNVTFNISPSDSINAGETVQITVDGDNIDTYSWAPINSNSNIISDSPTQTTTYVVTMSNNPCPSVIDSITIVVNYNDNIALITPNGFTPNGDGLNDVFRIVNYEEFESYTLKIYNRWGELLFEENKYGAAWDGKFNNEFQNHDTYIYYIDAKPFNGGENIISSGTVTMLR